MKILPKSDKSRNFCYESQFALYEFWTLKISKYITKKRWAPEYDFWKSETIWRFECYNPSPYYDVTKTWNVICQENIQVTLIGYKIIKGLEIARAKLQRTRIKITAVRWKLELFELENSEAVWKNNIVLTGTIKD